MCGVKSKNLSCQFKNITDTLNIYFIESAEWFDGEKYIHTTYLKMMVCFCEKEIQNLEMKEELKGMIYILLQVLVL